MDELRELSGLQKVKEMAEEYISYIFCWPSRSSLLEQI